MLTLPDDDRLDVDPVLQDLRHRLWSMSGFKGLPPSLLDVALADRGDILRALKWAQFVRWVEDEGKRNEMGMK